MESNWRLDAWRGSITPLGGTLLAHVHGSAGRWISNMAVGLVDHLVFSWNGADTQLATILDAEHIAGAPSTFPYGFVVDPDAPP